MSSLDESLDVEVAAASLDLAREPFVSLLGGDLAGFLDATGTVSGNLRQPDVIADLAWRDLAVGGRSLGREGRAELRLTMAQGELEVQGDFLGLVAVEGGGVADRGGFQLELGVSGDDLQGLLGLTAIEPVPDVQGSFQGTLALAGEFGGAEPWHAELELVEVGVEYASRRLQNLEPIVVRLEREAVILESLFVGDSESGSELFVAGRVGFEEARSIDLNLESSLETSWLQLLLPELGLREGRLDLLATVVGSISQPRFNGLGRLSGGRLLVPDLPHSLDRMEGLFLLNIGEIVVDQLQAEMAGGKVQAGGSMQLAEAGGEPTYRLQIAAVGLNLRYPENWLSRADAELSVASVEGGRSVRGAVRLDRAYYLQDVKMSLPQLLQGLFVQRRVEVETADELALTTQLNISVEGPGALRVRNNMADLRGDVDLIVRGTLARPIVFGRVEIDRGGTLSYAGTKYSVDNGVLNFANPFRIEPVIDLAASARVREYDVTLNLFGTLDRLNASFSSDPPLADLEVLSLITTGEETWTGPSSSVNGEASAATQATGLLYGQAASLISQRTSRLFGFDRVRLEPLTTSSGDLSTARVTVGKQVSRDLFITYSYDPSTTEQQIIQLEWNVVQGMTVVLTQEGDESYSVDLRWEKSF
jgi:translocation and assembly module TamB